MGTPEQDCENSELFIVFNLGKLVELLDRSNPIIGRTHRP
jgi:hypothetical protein